MGNNCCNNILLCGILNSSFLRLYATVIASTIPDYYSLSNNRVAKISMGAQFHTSKHDSGWTQSQWDTYPIVLFPLGWFKSDKNDKLDILLLFQPNSESFGKWCLEKCKNFFDMTTLMPAKSVPNFYYITHLCELEQNRKLICF